MAVASSADNFNCKNCRRRHCDETMEIDGSIGPAVIPMWEIKDVISSKICLLPMITPLSHGMLRLHGHYKNGYLPLAGGILDQPDGFLRAMEIIDSAIRNANAEK